jgi:hypothetical protein
MIMCLSFFYKVNSPTLKLSPFGNIYEKSQNTPFCERG